MLPPEFILLQTLRHAGAGLKEVVTDCSAVVRGLTKGRAWCTNSGRPHAAVWALIWSRLDDLGFEPHGNLKVTKVKAHMNKKHKEALYAVMKQYASSHIQRLKE